MKAIGAALALLGVSQAGLAAENLRPEQHNEAEAWGFFGATRLDWGENEVKGRVPHPEAIPPLEKGLKSHLLVILNRHGARAHSFPQNVPEFGGAGSRQLTRDGLNQLHAAGQEVREYFEKYMVRGATTATCAYPDARNPLRGKSEKRRYKPVYARTSCYTRVLWSARGWVGGFYNESRDKLATDEQLAGVGGCTELPPKLMEQFPPPATINTTMPFEQDGMSAGNFGGSSLPWVEDQVAQCMNEPVVKAIQETIRPRVEPVCKIMGKGACERLAWDIGDMVVAEEYYGVKEPLRAALTPMAKAKGLPMPTDEELDTAVVAAKEGMTRLGFFVFSYPTIRHTTACTLSLVMARLMRVRATGNLADAARLVEVLKRGTAFEELYQPLHDLEKAVTAGDEIAAAKQAARCLSVLLMVYHDSTIISVLSLFGVRSLTETPFGASVLFELVQGKPEKVAAGVPAPKDNDWYVRVLHGVPGGRKRLLPLPACEKYGLGGMCPLKEFERLAEADGRCEETWLKMLQLRLQQDASDYKAVRD